MNWQEPKTWNTGDLLTAQDMNAQLRDNLQYLKGLPYAQKTIQNDGNYTTRSSSFVDIDDSSLSITLRTTGAVLVGFLGTFQADQSTHIHLDLLVDGVRLGQNNGIASLHFPAAHKPQSLAFTLLRDQLTAGEHTFHLQWRIVAGFGIFYAAAGNRDAPAFFWARALP